MREREAHARKLVARETERLRDSFDQAEKAGFRKFIMFLHYPPTSILEETSPFTEIAKGKTAPKQWYIPTATGKAVSATASGAIFRGSDTCWYREII